MHKTTKSKVVDGLKVLKSGWARHICGSRAKEWSHCGLPGPVGSAAYGHN